MGVGVGEGGLGKGAVRQLWVPAERTSIFGAESRTATLPRNPAVSFSAPRARGVIRAWLAQGEMGRKVAINGEAISGSSTCNLLDSFGYTPGIGECGRSQARRRAPRAR